MGLILTVCEKCRSFLPENEELYSITVHEGCGFISNKKVCGTCYEQLSNQNEAKLLLEQA